jgi:hypothetical protein
MAQGCSNDVEMSLGLWWVDASSRRRAQSKLGHPQTNLLYIGKLPIEEPFQFTSYSMLLFFVCFEEGKRPTLFYP